MSKSSSSSSSSSSTSSIDLNDKPKEPKMSIVVIPPQDMQPQIVSSTYSEQQQYNQYNSNIQNNQMNFNQMNQSNQQQMNQNNQQTFTPQVDMNSDLPDDINNSNNTEKPKELQSLIQVISIRLISVFFFIFIMLVLVCYIICIFIPKAHVDNEISTWQCECVDSLNWNATCCKGVNFIKEEQLTFDVGPFTPSNQEFTIHGQFKNLRNGGNVGGRMNIGVDVIGLIEKEKNSKKYEEVRLYVNYPIEIEFECGNDYHCSEFMMFTLDTLGYERYRIVLHLQQTSVEIKYLGDLNIKVTTLNKDYTQFEVTWRFVFCLLSCIAMMIFMFFARKYPYDQWPFENKTTIYLSLFLIMFNNPFYTYEFVTGAQLFIFITLFFNSLFIVYLMFYILVIFEALRKPISWRTNWKFWGWRIAFFIIFFTMILITIMYNESVSLSNPSYDPLKNSATIFLGVVDIIFIITYIVWLLFSVIRTFNEAKRIGNTKRVYTYGSLVIICIVLFLIILIISFFMGLELSASIFLTLLSYANLFVWLLGIFYLPQPTKPIWDKARFILVEKEDIAEYKQLDDFMEDIVLNESSTSHSSSSSSDEK